MDRILKHFDKTEYKLADDDKGGVEAVFSVFNIRDHDGDVVKSGAIENESKVTMAWAHDWSKPIGKGLVTVDNDKAVFKGKFFIDTESGNEAYKIVKNMGDDQDWSWGFIPKEVQQADPEDYNGLETREILKAEIFEVSPVLRGANSQTQTVALKSKSRRSFADQCSTTLDVVKELVQRTSSLADLRAKDKRTIGKESSEMLHDVAEQLGDLADTLKNYASPNEDEYGHVSDQVRMEVGHFYRTKIKLESKEDSSGKDT